MLESLASHRESQSCALKHLFKNKPAYISACSLNLHYFEREVSPGTFGMKAVTDCRFYWRVPQLAPTQVSMS